MNERFRSTPPERRGEEVERDAFGTVRRGPRGIKRDIPNYEEYLPAMQEVRTKQPYNPENPTRPFARDLRIEVIDGLGFVDPREYSRVRVYTAIGSAFDRYHGVDAFVEIDLAEDVAVVTIDITTGPKDFWKADICVQLPKENLDPDLDEDAYLAMISKVGQAVVRKVRGDVQTKQYIV